MDLSARYADQVTHHSCGSTSHAFAKQVIKKPDSIRFLPPVLHRTDTARKNAGRNAGRNAGENTSNDPRIPQNNPARNSGRSRHGDQEIVERRRTRQLKARQIWEAEVRGPSQGRPLGGARMKRKRIFISSIQKELA